MYYRGSQRKLLGNSIEAMMAAVEVYNKPSIEYREECFVILLINAWELLLKAILSKNKKSIYYPKKRREPYRTLSWYDALKAAEKFFPKTIPSLPVRRNLELLGTYRDNATHFYNERDFRVVLYSLAQTNITTFRDCIEHFFGKRIEERFTWQLLPLGIRPPIDPLTYLGGTGSETPTSGAVRQYLTELKEAVEEVEAANGDTGRLLTVYSVKLESVKKIERADVTVGVTAGSGSGGPLTILKTQDPNKTHPLRQKDVIQRLGTVNGVKINSRAFQAIIWKHDLRENSQYCWRATEGVLTRYSNEVITFVKRLSKAEIEAAKAEYSKHLADRRKTAS